MHRVPAGTTELSFVLPDYLYLLMIYPALKRWAILNVRLDERCDANSRGGLQFRLISRRFLGHSGFYFRTPPELFQNRVRFSFNRIGNDLAQHRGELKSVSTISGRDNQIWTLRIGRDPEIAVVGVGIHAHARVD